ncbi:flagellar basal-body MS-ring/collar protein FliF [Salinibacterium sp. SYSU T00001]|uniref:flagellar basal-body MS-ring/collar protein FliF n=1 Tax=Homoserinimonas sedimenticola TaxID=2986805 RepID=UPI00223617BC|nr:flagellar basal-body MS-ring/collar protein FliF [Salinibacterium sedimenticola]MCW4385735.1 flagellar basal-body MS-ring/collar protein FliF [Salinibacterium sedimenticola]
MPTQVTSALRRLVGAIREFTIAQRTLALIGVGVLVLGAAGLGLWLSRPSYTPLFTGLAAADASTIVEQLRADNVPYELTSGGATILVPEEHVYEQRLKAASAGLPSSSTGGYSLLDDMGVTSSEFQQSVTYKRALEGELASTVAALDGVRTASVRLAIPEETVFVAQTAAPTASVFVETDRGVTLTTDQVEAIVHLTSASIEGMKATDVAVIDAAGTVLSAVGVGASGSTTQQASDHEARVQTAVQAMLDRVVGPGNASVVVAADVSYESAERLEESYTVPEDNPALNEQIDRETYQGGGEGAVEGGVLGPDNIAVPDAEGGAGTYESESTSRNNAVNKVTESRTIPAGSITRQTVSVAVNEDAIGGLTVPAIRELVAAAAGINDERGDAVAVEVVPFNATGAAAAAEALAAAEAAAASERWMSLATVAVIVAGIALPIIIGLVMLNRNRRRARDAGELRQLSDILEGTTMPMQLPVPSAPAAVAAAPAAPVLPQGGGAANDAAALAAAAASQEADRRRAEIEALAASDPKRTADYLRGLMDDVRAP